MLNHYLQEQIEKYYGSTHEFSQNLKELLQAISESYDKHAEDKLKLEHELNNQVRNETIELKKTSHELKTLFENIDDVFFSVDMIQRKLVQISPSCEKIYGYSAGDFLKNVNLWYDVVVEEDKKIVLRNYPDMHSGNHFTQEYRICKKDGAIRWLETKIAPTIDATGRLLRIDGLVSDITERKQNEQLLKESEAKYRSFFENSIDGILLTQTNGHILDANPAACSIFQMTKEEICRRGRSGLIDTKDPKFHAFLKERERKGNVKGEITFIRKNGSKFFGEFSSAVFIDALGTTKTSVIIRDITDRIKANSQIEFEKRNRDALINSTDDLIWGVDTQMNLIAANQSFLQEMKKLTDIHLKPGDHLLLDKKFPKETVKAWEEFYKRALSGEAFIMQFHNLTPVESFSETSFHPIYKDELITGASCFSRDITERKKAEEEIILKKNQLRALSNHLQFIREEERTSIAREIHDELGQQITSLKMDIDWIMHTQNNPDKATTLKLQKMLQLSDRLITTIRKISSDLRPAIIDDLGIIAALEWMCDDFSEKTGISCLFTSTIKERKFESNFSITIYRILQESLTNVMRHARAKLVTVSVSEDETELFLEVIDNGKGIQLENTRKVKTLGILGMKERAALLGGELSIAGKKNKGTHIKLRLPFKHENINS